MHNVLIAGAGKIGALITCLLLNSGDYKVSVADLDFSGSDIKRLREKFPALNTVTLDASDKSALSAFLSQNKMDAIVSSLPYFCNVHVAEVAKEFSLHYFDLTEDTSVTDKIRTLAEGASNAFVPQCGLAPGFIGIAANTLMQNFAKIDAVKMRVGALPENVNNALHYAMTWSTDGLINEYGNPCDAIKNGEKLMVLPLQGLEKIQLDGVEYEAFNTSGGLGSMVDIYRNKVNVMNYKTMRYPGHCHKMRLLMNDLKLNSDRETLKRVLENAIPKTYQDIVIVYVSVTGQQGSDYIEENYVKKVFPQTIARIRWSAIQVTTAAGITAVLDLVLNQQDKYHGFVFQEAFSLDEVTHNRFGKYYA